VSRPPREGVTDLRVTVAYTGLLRIEGGRSQDVFDLPAGAVVDDVLARVAEVYGTSRDAALAGYFVVLERPGEPARALGPDGGREALVDGTRLTLLYRFAGG